MIDIPLPTDHISFFAWANRLAEELSAYNVQAPTSEDEWQLWASQFPGLPELGRNDVPDPYGFDNWRTWAQRLYDNLE